jgi:hypothetical protein
VIALTAYHEVEVPKKKLVGKDSGTGDNSTGHILNKVTGFAKFLGHSNAYKE